MMTRGNMVWDATLGVWVKSPGDATIGMAVAGNRRRYYEIAPVVDISGIYAGNDVLTDMTTIPGALLAAGKVSVLRSFQVVDEENNAAFGMQVFFFRSNAVTLGVKNIAGAISDLDFRECTGWLNIATTTTVTPSGLRMYTTLAQPTPLDIPLYATAGVDTYFQILLSSGGTPTFTNAASLRVKIGIEQFA